jgi:hypothetical protein
MQCSKRAACLSTINVCAARIGNFLLLLNCVRHMTPAACFGPSPCRKKKDFRQAVARLAVRCLVTSQNDPKKGNALTLRKT